MEYNVVFVRIYMCVSFSMCVQSNRDITVFTIIHNKSINTKYRWSYLERQSSADARALLLRRWWSHIWSARSDTSQSCQLCPKPLPESCCTWVKIPQAVLRMVLLFFLLSGWIRGVFEGSNQTISQGNCLLLYLFVFYLINYWYLFFGQNYVVKNVVGNEYSNEH